MVSVSCCFTWDLRLSERLVKEYRDAYPDARVSLGGPVFGLRSNSFEPGRFVREGVTFTSRGCPNNCPWCVVPGREGELRLLPITSGYIVNDNNLLACPRPHIESVVKMLRTQRNPAKLAGGIQASLVKDWHGELFRSIRISEIFLAADHMGAIGPLRKAVRIFKMTRKKLRCYVLIGFEGESI
ncbi:hypothetical protein LCGC14_1438180 [marine sediment metagenome]|uniref:Radical SAM core domain-containing protein n=1 Tax=marine sediment metagenome TaxID=412755 RepID=A0A0F9M1Z0_9ZZZZ